MCIALEIDAKTDICTDNLSVIQTILYPLSHHWDTVNQIRNMLISNADLLKILWMPGYMNILGSEKEDQAAKYARLAHILMVDIIEKTYIKNAIDLFIQNKQIK